MGYQRRVHGDPILIWQRKHTNHKPKKMEFKILAFLCLAITFTNSEATQHEGHQEVVDNFEFDRGVSFLAVRGECCTCKSCPEDKRIAHGEHERHDLGNGISYVTTRGKCCTCWFCKKDNLHA